MKRSGTKGLLATGASAAWAKQRGATGFVSLVVEKLARYGLRIGSEISLTLSLLAEEPIFTGTEVSQLGQKAFEKSRFGWDWDGYYYLLTFYSSRSILFLIILLVVGYALGIISFIGNF